MKILIISLLIGFSCQSQTLTLQEISSSVEDEKTVETNDQVLDLTGTTWDGSWPTLFQRRNGRIDTVAMTEFSLNFKDSTNWVWYEKSVPYIPNPGGYHYLYDMEGQLRWDMNNENLVYAYLSSGEKPWQVHEYSAIEILEHTTKTLRVNICRYSPNGRGFIEPGSLVIRQKNITLRLRKI